MPGVSSITTRPKPNRRKQRDGKYRHTHNKNRSHHEIGVTQFVGIDGEGITLEHWQDCPRALRIQSPFEHRYVLLGVGDDQISDPVGLDWKRIFEFLYEHQDKGTAFVGFYLSYDFTMWLRSLPMERAWRLLTREGMASRKPKSKKLKHQIFPVEHDGWQFDMLPGRRLKLRPKLCTCEVPACKCKKAPWMYICDVGGYFQTSLLKVLDPKNWPVPVVTDDEYEALKRGKEARGDAGLDEDMRYYNRLENAVLARLMTIYDKGLRDIGVNLSPSQWFGPGQAAQKWLRGRAPTGATIAKTVPLWFLEAARQSYFGGWTEPMMHGIVPGEIHGYDINSAYPHVIAKLPCLLHGEYKRGHGKPPLCASDSYTLVRARVWSKAYNRRNIGVERYYLGAMLHRDEDGSITRPMVTEGWYWLHELKAAMRLGCVTPIRKERWYEWVSFTPGQCPPHCHPYPIREIANLYLKRLAVGKNTPMGKAAKLVYNSCYGKFAQSVGNPVYGNSVYASLITAGCRTQILDAIATHPKGAKDVVMVATDCVYFLSEHPSLRCSEDLGQWDHTVRSNVTIFKPGVYWDDKARREIATGKSPTFKARGIDATQFAGELARVDRIFRAWNGTPPTAASVFFRRKGESQWPVVVYRPSFPLVSGLQALMRKRWELAGSVSSNALHVDQSIPYLKRGTKLYYDPERSVYRSEPRWFGFGSGVVLDRRLREVRAAVTSHAYEKKFGIHDPSAPERLEILGITPTGPVPAIFAEALGLRA